jgi:hypothetical protein
MQILMCIPAFAYGSIESNRAALRPFRTTRKVDALSVGFSSMRTSVVVCGRACLSTLYQVSANAAFVRRRLNNMFRDPRSAFGDLLWTRTVAGAKGVRYMVTYFAGR